MDAGALVTLLFGPFVLKTKGVAGVIESVVDLWRKAKGERPREVIKDEKSGTTIVVIGDSNRFSVDSNVADAYSSDATREALQRIVRPLRKEGIDAMDIRKDKIPTTRIERNEVESIPEQPEPAASASEQAPAGENTREVLLRVTRANFAKGKWGFTDGNARFSATITDEAFKKQIQNRQIGFFQGDTLKVILRIAQSTTPKGALSSRYEVEHVIQYNRTPIQTHLLEP